MAASGGQRMHVTLSSNHLSVLMCQWRSKVGPAEDELAFYDALETNDSAVQVLGDETLCLSPGVG